MSLIDVHTHPFGYGPVAFSAHDEHNMRLTHAEFQDRVPQDPPAAAASLVLGPGGQAGAWSPPDGTGPAALDSVTLIGTGTREIPLCAA